MARKNYSIPTNPTPYHHTQFITATSVSMLNLNTPTILPPVDKEYMCFQKDGKTDQASRCIQSRITTKVIDYVLSTNTFEQQSVVIKCML